LWIARYGIRNFINLRYCNGRSKWLPLFCLVVQAIGQVHAEPEGLAVNPADR